MLLRNSPISVVLPAEDIKRAKRFYSEKLGLRSPDMPVPEDSAFFECGDDTMLYIYEYEGGGSKAGYTAATWLVDDVEKAVKDMSNRGVTFERYNRPDLETDERGIADLDGAKTAWFRDTEDNILAITSVPS
jgi:predicted enzyme related to lactoylglutathione lyase